MALLLSQASLRVYDALKSRLSTRPRVSDARDVALVAAITGRMNELIGVYRLSTQEVYGQTYVFWPDLERLVGEGVFDDFLERL